jgi:flagellar biosynthetic protein FliP
LRTKAAILFFFVVLGLFAPQAAVLAQDGDAASAAADGAQAQAGDEAKADENPLLPQNGLFGTEDIGLALKIVIIMSGLTLLPALVLTMTSFTRIIVILSFVKRAMGTQDLPPHQIVVGFAIFLTLAIMAPVFVRINEEAVKPYNAEQITLAQAGERAMDVMGRFLLKHTRPDDIALMVHISKAERPGRPEDVPLYILVPAFALSEIKTAFQMGFIIFLPFLVIDIVIASVLLSMGMFMLPPIIISTPFKIILFVLVDGWTLVIASLVKSFVT